MYFFVQHDDLKIWFQKIGTFRAIEHGCSVQIIVIRTRIIKQDKDPLCKLATANIDKRGFRFLELIVLTFMNKNSTSKENIEKVKY